MSPWWNRWRALPAKATGRLAAMTASIETVWSRRVLCVDDDCVRLCGAGGRRPIRMQLARAGDVAAALEAVESLLQATPVDSRRRGMHRVEVVVSGGFACYFVLPWAPLPRPVDWLAAARTRFALDGIGAPEAWRFSIEDAPWGCARMGAAVPEVLCAGIARLCKARGLQLGRIEPAFTRSVSRNATRIEDGSIAIVQLEERGGGRSVAHVGFRNEKQWTGYVALPAAARIGYVLRDAALLCRAVPLQRTYLIAPAQMQAAMGDLPDAHWLPSHAGDIP